MRRVLVTLLVLCMLVPSGALAGDLYAGDRVTMEMAVWNSVETYEKLNVELIAAFPEMADKLDIEVVIEGDGDAGVAEKMRLLLASGEPLPDMVRLNYTQYEEFRSADLLYDLSDAIAPYKEEIIPAVLEMMTGEDGGVYCMPQEVKPKIWYYRTDVFEKAGVNPEDVNTVDELIEAAKKVNEATGTFIENYIPPFNAYDLVMLLSGNGGKFYDEKGDFTIASDAGVRTAFETLKKYYDSGAFSSIVEWSADWQAGFISGALSSQLIGAWMKQHLINWCPDQAGLWSCALWPEEIRSGSEAGMGIWVVFKGAANPELAADVLAKYSFDPNFRKTVYAMNGIIPPLESAKTDDFYATHAYFGTALRDVYFEAMETLAAYPYTPTFSAEQKIVVNYLNEYVNGNMTLDDALNASQSDLINQIGNVFE